MVTFRCKRSGNTVSFTNPDDIAGLRKHEGYTEVLNEAETAEKTVETIEAKKEERPLLKLKRGRPRK